MRTLYRPVAAKGIFLKWGPGTVHTQSPGDTWFGKKKKKDYLPCPPQMQGIRPSVELEPGICISAGPQAFQGTDFENLCDD